MKKALIIHGWDGSPDEPLHRYLKLELGRTGYVVKVPVMPNPDAPVIKDWLTKISQEFSEEYLFVGHSIGCQAILRFLEILDGVKIPKVILIAPWMKLDLQTLKEEGQEVVEIAKPWMETSIDFEKVKNKVGEFFVIFSDDDPYISLDQAEFFKENLGAKVFVEHDQGHFTESDNFAALQTPLTSLV